MSAECPGGEDVGEKASMFAPGWKKSDYFSSPLLIENFEIIQMYLCSHLTHNNDFI